MPDTNNLKIGIVGCNDGPAKKYGKILVMGRAQTGKSTIAEKLAEMTGLKLLKTCTTRPRRFPEENIYHFYDPEKAKAIPIQEKLFHTLAVDGFERWTNKSDFLEAGIAVLDPTGAAPAIRLWRAQGYNVTVLYCEAPDEIRRTRWIESTAGGAGPDAYDAAILNFNHREQTEAPMFDELEKQIRTIQELDAADAMLYPNAPPQIRTVYHADRLELVQTSKTDTDKFLGNFTRRLLDAGGLPRPGFHVFPSACDLELQREYFTQDEWDFVCSLFDLLPETAYTISVTAPSISAYVHPDADSRSEHKITRG